MKLTNFSPLVSFLLSMVAPGSCSTDHATRTLHLCNFAAHSIPLEREKVKYLAESSNDIYNHTKADCANKIYKSTRKDGLILKECYEGGSEGLSDFLRYGLYRVEETGETILAFMGTDSFTNLQETGCFDIDDLSQLKQVLSGIGFAGSSIFDVTDRAVEIYERLQPTYVTGHSLGGTIAEMVCDQTGAKGASFGAPGPYGLATETNLLKDGKYDGAKFSVIINKNDFFGASSLLNCALGYQSCHVACSDEVVLLDFPADGDSILGHSAKYYSDEIWNGNW